MFPLESANADALKETRSQPASATQWRRSMTKAKLLSAVVLAAAALTTPAMARGSFCRDPARHVQRLCDLWPRHAGRAFGGCGRLRSGSARRCICHLALDRAALRNEHGLLIRSKTPVPIRRKRGEEVGLKTSPPQPDLSLTFLQCVLDLRAPRLIERRKRPKGQLRGTQLTHQFQLGARPAQFLKANLVDR